MTDNTLYVIYARTSSRVPSWHAVFSSSGTRPSPSGRRRSCAKGGRRIALDDIVEMATEVLNALNH